MESNQEYFSKGISNLINAINYYRENKKFEKSMLLATSTYQKCFKSTFCNSTYSCALNCLLGRALLEFGRHDIGMNHLVNITGDIRCDNTFRNVAAHLIKNALLPRLETNTTIANDHHYMGQVYEYDDEPEKALIQYNYAFHLAFGNQEFTFARDMLYNCMNITHIIAPKSTDEYRIKLAFTLLNMHANISEVFYHLRIAEQNPNKTISDSATALHEKIRFELYSTVMKANWPKNDPILKNLKVDEDAYIDSVIRKSYDGLRKNKVYIDKFRDYQDSLNPIEKSSLTAKIEEDIVPLDEMDPATLNVLKSIQLWYESTQSLEGSQEMDFEKQFESMQARNYKTGDDPIQDPNRNPYIRQDRVTTHGLGNTQFLPPKEKVNPYRPYKAQ